MAQSVLSERISAAFGCREQMEETVLMVQADKAVKGVAVALEKVPVFVLTEPALVVVVEEVVEAVAKAVKVVMVAEPPMPSIYIIME